MQGLHARHRCLGRRRDRPESRRPVGGRPRREDRRCSVACSARRSTTSSRCRWRACRTVTGSTTCRVSTVSTCCPSSKATRSPSSSCATRRRRAAGRLVLPPACVFNMEFLNANSDRTIRPTRVRRGPDGTARPSNGPRATRQAAQRHHPIRRPAHVWNGSDIGATPPGPHRCGDDRITSSEGDDTLHGNGGNDVIEAGSGNDNVIGGLGDDILKDLFGDDVLKGGPMTTSSAVAPGFDLLQGDRATTSSSPATTCPRCSVARATTSCSPATARPSRSVAPVTTGSKAVLS